GRGKGGGDLFTALGHYTLFHLIVIALFVAWAGRRLRAVALLQAFGSTGRSLLRRVLKPVPRSAARPARPRSVSRATSRPEFGDSPVLWKEVFVDTGIRLGGFGRAIILFLVALSFVPVVIIFTLLFIWDVDSGLGPWYSAARWEAFGQAMNTYLRT